MADKCKYTKEEIQNNAIISENGFAFNKRDE